MSEKTTSYYQCHHCDPSLQCGFKHFKSTLVQVMACCLMAPSHYLIQYWLMISRPVDALCMKFYLKSFQSRKCTEIVVCIISTFFSTYQLQISAANSHSLLWIAHVFVSLFIPTWQNVRQWFSSHVSFSNQYWLTRVTSFRAWSDVLLRTFFPLRLLEADTCDLPCGWVWGQRCPPHTACLGRTSACTSTRRRRAQRSHTPPAAGIWPSSVKVHQRLEERSIHGYCRACAASDMGLSASVPLPIVMGIFVLLGFQSS